MISFENIRTGEVVKFTAEQDPVSRQAHMAAYLNSSNLSPNALKGQDFGWRLAPEIVAEMERIKQDLQTLDTIAKRVGVGVEDIKDQHVLNFMAEREFAAVALKNKQSSESSKFKADYDARLEKLLKGDTGAPEADNANIEVPKQTNTKEKK